MDMSQWEVEFAVMEKSEAVMLIPVDQPNQAFPFSGLATHAAVGHIAATQNEHS